MLKKYRIFGKFFHRSSCTLSVTLRVPPVSKGEACEVCTNLEKAPLCKGGWHLQCKWLGDCSPLSLSTAAPYNPSSTAVRRSPFPLWGSLFCLPLWGRWLPVDFAVGECHADGEGVSQSSFSFSQGSTSPQGGGSTHTHCDVPHRRNPPVPISPKVFGTAPLAHRRKAVAPHIRVAMCHTGAIRRCPLSAGGAYILCSLTTFFSFLVRFLPRN